MAAPLSICTKEERRAVIHSLFEESVNRPSGIVVNDVDCCAVWPRFIMVSLDHPSFPPTALGQQDDEEVTPAGMALQPVYREARSMNEQSTSQTGKNFFV
ncbi:hypothetical protein TNCV_3012601 [Trichonephila clavipes]|nr:hypothetical protein TNCV_3012601 [Trichonephila clavipes]